MKAVVFMGKEEGLSYQEWPQMDARDNEVWVKVKAAALNHRDVWICKGLYPGIKSPCILGSDAAGEIENREVLINPNINWGEDQRFPDPQYRILGMPDNGSLAEYILVSRDRLHDKPAHLSWEEAAALPLAGLTAYRSLFTKGQLKAGDKVLVTGTGGGVALMAVQFAVVAGATVYVTSGSDEKIQKAVALGASGGVNYKQEDWADQLKGLSPGGFDLIIDSAGGTGFNTLIKRAAQGGRIVTYGGSLGAVPKFSPQAIFWKQISIHGTSMGSDQDFEAMLAFVNEHQVKPVVDSIFTLAEAQKAFDKMDKGQQFGKIVIVP